MKFSEETAFNSKIPKENHPRRKDQNSLKCTKFSEYEILHLTLNCRNKQKFYRKKNDYYNIYPESILKGQWNKKDYFIAPSQNS